MVHTITYTITSLCPYLEGFQDAKKKAFWAISRPKIVHLPKPILPHNSYLEVQDEKLRAGRGPTYSKKYFVHTFIDRDPRDRHYGLLLTFRSLSLIAKACWSQKALVSGYGAEPMAIGCMDHRFMYQLLSLLIHLGRTSDATLKYMSERIHEYLR